MININAESQQKATVTYLVTEDTIASKTINTSELMNLFDTPIHGAAATALELRSHTATETLFDPADVSVSYSVEMPSFQKTTENYSITKDIFETPLFNTLHGTAMNDHTDIETFEAFPDNSQTPVITSITSVNNHPPQSVKECAAPKIMQAPVIASNISGQTNPPQSMKEYAAPILEQLPIKLSPVHSVKESTASILIQASAVESNTSAPPQMVQAPVIASKTSAKVLLPH